MQSIESLKYFEKNLCKFFSKYGRHNLPWREPHTTPYEVWVSEIMLQQTQAKRVIGYYKRFLEKFPDVFTLAKSSWREFFPYYQGLGYYQRGRNMIKTAKVIVRKYDGIFPKDKTLLKNLPGIGEYTARAILSFAYNERMIAFDTNAQRVYGRYFYGNKNAKVDVPLLEGRFSLTGKILNSSVMDFANHICKKNPRCKICPVQKKCQYYLEGGKNENNPRSLCRMFPKKHAQVYLWLHKNHKEYYSLNPDTFEVFILPPPINTREYIKKYFKKKYGLEISVRPPHKKIYINGIPTLFINAQILLGKHHFAIFKKEDMPSITPNT